MPESDVHPLADLRDVLATVRRYWGYDSLRPLQEAAIRAGLERRDSLVVLPTGGGKSLCYQVPAVLAGGTDVVVSPLIALMKDQVDGLRECGYPATALHSGIEYGEIQQIERDMAAGRIRLVFAAPERLLTPRMLALLKRLPVRAFSIDEAHCISQWGHDFRPEYRQLAALKEQFPQASVHAYTATATPRVREDIVAQLKLDNPHVLVGTFDRPNLVYRIIPRTDVHTQTLQAVKRHAGQAVIVYCLSRRDTEEMAAFLKEHRIKASAYHAGMSADQRRRTQDAFAREELDVIAATVAFGMGIDRSDVRCVIHATIPKSIEHYQQETGRAGRDGLEAECVLFYSAADVIRWESLIEKSAAEAEDADRIIRAMRQLLAQMQRLASGMSCRHKMLSEYFGQAHGSPNCGACDVCLDEMESIPDANVVAQKILSCVARVEQRFGVGHVVEVLLGAETERIHQCGHDKLSTYGLLKGFEKKSVTNWTHQLIDQGVLARSEGEYPTLRLNEASWEVMRGQRSVRLLQPKTAGVKRTRTEEVAWEGVDKGLFESLRELRRVVAAERSLPAYVIMGDATLRELAAVRPSSLRGFISVRGVGQRKAAELGQRFIRHIVAYCDEHKLSLDAVMGSRQRTLLPNPSVNDRSPGVRKRVSGAKRAAFDLFAKGRSVEEVAEVTDRAHSTTMQYLVEYIERERPPHIQAWVDDATYRRVAEIATQVGTSPLRTIFEKCNAEVPYETIRLVARHLNVRE